MDYSETSDILGQPTLPIVPGPPPPSWLTPTTTVAALFVLAVAVLVALRIRREVLHWQEVSYKR